MNKCKEHKLTVYGTSDGGGWRVVIWLWLQVKEKYGILLQTIDRSESWYFDDMCEAFQFCFNNGLVPVDEFGTWTDSGDLNAGFGEAEPVPLIAWRRYWVKDAPCLVAKL